MKFYDRLLEQTASARHYVESCELIHRSIAGETGRETYVAFLMQAYHHVRHTVPLLMAAGAELSDGHAWLRPAIAQYIEEENGHEEWILDDIHACGYSRESARGRPPGLATELLVAYAYDSIRRVSPLSLFGMVLVLEGTSISAASAAADGIQRSAGLPDSAFTYLRSHGALDQDHMRFFEDLMNRVERAADQDVILHSARVFYRLYGDVLRSVEAAQARTLTVVESGINLEGETHHVA